MKPMFWPPPSVSALFSVCTPGVPPAVPSGARPVAAKNSACLVLGWMIASARPVSGTMPPWPPLSV